MAKKEKQKNQDESDSESEGKIEQSIKQLKRNN
jgi:hypothetical protein